MSYPVNISVVVLCRNEKKYIEKCLDSIIAQDYPKDKLEVIVVDGMSEDGTRGIIERYGKKYPFIRMINNHKKVTPIAFNIGIKNSNGDLIMIMSAHATYERDYIKKCVDASQKYNADNVVGVWKILPRRNTLIAKAIVLALSTSFGVGNAKYRIIGSNKQPIQVDTGAYGCYKREVFKKIGLFNENLVRGQDMEFNLRLKKAGGKILLVPDAVVYYYARSNFKSFCKHNFHNGVWAILPFKYANIMPVSLRHLIPLVFILGILGTGVLSIFSALFSWIFSFIIAFYFVISLYFSTLITLKEKDIRLIFIMPFIFAVFHFSYGLGSIWGLVTILFLKL
jgi:cellulose synthase/poly-beta-1,6-N-acetylglucosamine synthase-like glycosyltransferase